MTTYTHRDLVGLANSSANEMANLVRVGAIMPSAPASGRGRHATYTEREVALAIAAVRLRRIGLECRRVAEIVGALRDSGANTHTEKSEWVSVTVEVGAVGGAGCTL